MTPGWMLWLIGCHSEGVGQAWEAGPCERYEIKQGQVQCPAPGSGQHPVSIQTGSWRNWEWPCGENLGAAGGWKAGHELTNIWLQPRCATISWAASKEVWPADRRRWFCPSILLWWDPTWSTASSTGALSTGKTWTCWSGSKGGSQKWSEEWNTSPMRKGWESWACWAWGREGSRKTLLQPFNIWKECKRDVGTDCFIGPVVKGQGVFRLQEGRFRLGIRKMLFARGMVKHWNMFPREVGDTLSLETLKFMLVRDLSNLI